MIKQVPETSKINPDNDNELVAGFWTVQRKPWTLVDGSDEGGVFMSKDGGVTN